LGAHAPKVDRDVRSHTQPLDRYRELHDALEGVDVG